MAEPWPRSYGDVVRLFVADGTNDDWSELTSDDRPAIRLAAPDLQRAQRGTARIRSQRSDVAVILDIAVAVPGDFRSSIGDEEILHYAGTVDGLTGLIADIELAGVADGVTLIPERPQQDVRALGHDVLNRLRARASA